MLTLLFTILMIMVFGKLIVWAFKATWGITKILVTVVLLPFMLIALFASGFAVLALIVLVIVGIISLFGREG